ncbi:MAG: hypothetical protein GY858_01165 [Candidatus Omnitrophica bacterium]|nr:hypothetical protein [Candidatus Omnitrophota bacterium]
MITLISIADRKYLAYLKVLVRSAKANFPEAEMYCVLVNCKDSICDEYISTELKGAALEAFCANLRTSVLHKLRQKREGILVWMDADTIIRKPCNGLIKHLKSCDVTAREKDKSGYFTGLVGINDTKQATSFLDKWNEKMKGKDNWFADQHTFDDVSNDYDVKTLPLTYLDFKLNNDSVIWVGKGRKIRKALKEEMLKWGVEWENAGSDPPREKDASAVLPTLKEWNELKLKYRRVYKKLQNIRKKIKNRRKKNKITYRKIPDTIKSTHKDK